MLRMLPRTFDQKPCVPHPQLEPQAEERGGVSPLLMAHLPQGGYY